MAGLEASIGGYRNYYRKDGSIGLENIGKM